MTINITVFVQMLHFALAYLILNRIFLKNGIAVIDEQDHTMQDLHYALEHDRQLVTKKQKNLQTVWRERKNILHHLQPEFLETVAIAQPSEAREEYVVKMADQESHIIAHELKKKIIQRVADA
jgi:hypothetical protein